jgi:hypothetical protein
MDILGIPFNYLENRVLKISFYDYHPPPPLLLSTSVGKGNLYSIFPLLGKKNLITIVDDLLC